MLGRVLFAQMSTWRSWPEPRQGNTSDAPYLGVPQKVSSGAVSVAILAMPKSGHGDREERIRLEQEARAFEIAVGYSFCVEVAQAVEYLSPSTDILVVKDICIDDVSEVKFGYDDGGRLRYYGNAVAVGF